MRITLVNQFYTPDIAPTAHLAASLAEHRASQGDDVRVITSLGGYVATSEESRSKLMNGVRVHRIWTPQFGKSSNLLRAIDYGLFYLFALLRIVTLPRQDVIVTMTTPPYIGLIAAAHKLIHWRTKVVLWNMDCYPDVLEPVGMIRKGGIVSRFLRWLVRLEFRGVDYLVTLDDAMTDLLIDQYAPKGRELPTKVIPNWERLSLFPIDSPTPSRWTEADSLGLTDELFTIIYLGNTGYGHTFETVLDAAEALRDQPVRFLFIGGGRRWSDIAAAVKERQLDNVIMHSYVPKEQTPSVMALADCALITLTDWSLGIMSPSKLHACLAMGLPVIYVGPQRSNVDLAIDSNQCGVSLRHGDVDGFAEFARRAASDPAYLAEKRQLARKAFDQNYCDAQTLPQFDHILAELTS